MLQPAETPPVIHGPEKPLLLKLHESATRGTRFLQMGYFGQRESRVIHSYETPPFPFTAHVPYCSLIALISWAAARDAVTRAAFTGKLLQRPPRTGVWQTGAGEGLRESFDCHI